MVRRLAIRVAAALSAVALSLVGATSMAAAATPASVTISSSGCGGGRFFCYKPSALTVTDGGGVKWTDVSGVGHTVTRCTIGACSGTGPGSGTGAFTNSSIPARGTFTHTFHGTGTYNYYCTIHGFAAMHGTVTVAPK